MKAIKEAIKRTQERIENAKNEYWHEVRMDPDDVEDEFNDVESWRNHLDKIQREISRLEGMREGFELSLGMIENEN